MGCLGLMIICWSWRGSPTGAGVLLATAVVGDSAHPLVPTVTLVYTLSVIARVTGVDSEDPDASSGGNRTTVVAPTFFGELLTLSLVGGLPPYSYGLVGDGAGLRC